MFSFEVGIKFVSNFRYLALVFVASGCLGGGGDDAAGGAAGGGTSTVTLPVSSNGFMVQDSMSVEEAARFLNQATFGATEVSIDRLVRIGYSQWIQSELQKPISSQLSVMLTKQSALKVSGKGVQPDDKDKVDHRDIAQGFWMAAIRGDDQLRQRAAFALSQITVIAYRGNDQIGGKPLGVGAYMDILARGAFGHYRDFIEEVTYSPMMAIYLTYLKNVKANPDKGTVPDENYAREVMQLFSIGLLELNQNGSVKLDSSGNPIETYSTLDVTEMAKVFTGLSYKGEKFYGDHADDAYYAPLQMFDEYHSDQEKSFLGITIPAETSGTDSIALALDRLAAHDNTAPFLTRQLIQRFVTSNPDPNYIHRVSLAFIEGQYLLPNGQTVGTGRRGDMAATISAVLLDPEARDPANITNASFGKIREPVIRFTHWARAFPINSFDVDNRTGLTDTQNANRLSQQAFRSPSVFNFYRPGYVAPGSETGGANLVAPELQITHETSVIAYANFMRDFTNETRTERSYVANFNSELAFASDPDALVQRLNLILMGGAMHPETRTRITDAINSIEISSNNTARDQLRRVQAAVLMATTSPDFIVQR